MIRTAAMMTLISASFVSADDVVVSSSAKVNQATAKPGSTVTIEIALELAGPWHTYPTAQPSPDASSFVNKVRVSPTADVVPVGKPIDPAKPKVKSEKELGIDELLYYPGGGIYKQKVVISPNAKAGTTVEYPIKFVVQCCDANTCLPPKTLEMVVKIQVEGEAVPVEAQYAAEVEKALKK